ncbi:hypothetical protein BDN72DRAFT_265175 [Pluteus cervinus]|uniref:Uncharacterized protein n=1 Tax=Pluteus cervinus TaxID=181527 RepID=A0ACD3AFL6_9AGAR|nr:hypothetical protein BDN72DRAFT_265175 [Pluteus cervinus]
MPKDDKPQIDTFKTKVTESGIVVTILTFLLTCLFKYFTRGAVPLDVRTITSSGLVCRSPTAVIQKWAINTFLPDADGRPAPVEYTLNHHKPHRLSLIDIDHRDMMMAVHVDNVLRGQTTDFAIDTNMDCGEDIGTCLQLNFSGGVVVVPPGDHTVKITWVGKEFVPGTNEMNWGGDYSRRFKWQIEGCS